jgi:hypothetical protein
MHREGDICPERKNLLRRIIVAVEEHARAVSNLAHIVGTDHRKEFHYMTARAKECFEATQMAWAAYEKHVKEHDCE